MKFRLQWTTVTLSVLLDCNIMLPTNVRQRLSQLDCYKSRIISCVFMCIHVYPCISMYVHVCSRVFMYVHVLNVLNKYIPIYIILCDGDTALFLHIFDIMILVGTTQKYSWLLHICRISINGEGRTDDIEIDNVNNCNCG